MWAGSPRVGYGALHSFLLTQNFPMKIFASKTKLGMKILGTKKLCQKKGAHEKKFGNEKNLGRQTNLG